MNESFVPITPGSGESIDTFKVGGLHRQAMVISDPTTAGNVAAVDAALGLSVNVTNTPSVTFSGTQNVNVQSSVPNLTLTSIPAVTGSVSITGTPTVSIVDTPTVNVTSSVPNLTLTSLPVVTTTHSKTMKSVTGSTTITSTIISAVTSKKLKVFALEMLTQSATAFMATFKDGVGGTAKRTYPMQAASGTMAGIAQSVTPPASLFETSAGNPLELATSINGLCLTYNVSYWDDDAT